MNAIQKAIKILRMDAAHGFVESGVVADELEALLKQEPAGFLVKDRAIFVSLDRAPSNADVLYEWERVYKSPRPTCDLKALAEDVRSATIAATKIQPALDSYGTKYYQVVHAPIDLDAIIKKHGG